MGAGTGFDPALVVAIVGGLTFLAALISFGSLLFTSAAVTKKHLANAATLGPGRSSATSASTDASASAAAPAPEPLGFIAPQERGAGENSLPAAPGNDGASRRTFALLNEYYLANISQANTIFWASLLAMSLGFAIIFIGVVLAGLNPTTAIVATTAGVLSQFVGATFLVVLRSTQTQATAYAQSLVDLRSHDVRAAADAQAIALGLQLLSEIPADKTDGLVDRTRAAIAMSLIVNSAVTGAPVIDADTIFGPTPPVTPSPQARTRAESVIFDQTSGNREQQRTSASAKP